MKTYPAYKESGIEWLGEIPAHWEVKRLKYIAEINPSKGNISGSHSTQELIPFLPMESVFENGSFIVSQKKPLESLNSGFTFFRENDVLLAKITPCFENGKGTILENLGSPFGFGSTEFHVFRPKDKTARKFLFYLTRSHRFKEIGEAFMSGAAGQKRVSTYFLTTYVLGFPPLPEQRTIAAYLDHKTTQIDTLIADKRRLIELYQEERAALINQAVNRGLDPDVPMKDSGIEWLGEIPAHWEVRKISRSFRQIGSGTTPKSGNPEYYENGNVPWLITGDLNDGLVSSTSKMITQQALLDHSTLKIFPKGSLVIAMYGATIGKVAITDIAVCTNQACCVLGDSPFFLSKFAFYWFIVNKRHIISLGYGGGQPNISQELIRTLKIPVPSIEEQERILIFLDHKTTQIDILISDTEKEIQLLEEYRTALISEVVTGKIDVRDKAPSTTQMK